MAEQDYDPQAPVRFPLAVATNPRNADLTKDALLKNCYIDGSQIGTKYAVKRPGFYVGSEAVTTGLMRGIYVNPNNPSNQDPPTKEVVGDEITVWYISNDSLGSAGGVAGSNLQNVTISTLPPPPVGNYSVNFILVGPGGNGGFGADGTGINGGGGGGGGGGDVIASTLLVTSSISYPVTVGMIQGEESVFSSWISISGENGEDAPPGGSAGAGGLSGTGGSGGNGGTGTLGTNGQDGSDGVTSSISGLSVEYGASGGGGGGSASYGGSGANGKTKGLSDGADPLFSGTNGISGSNYGSGGAGGGGAVQDNPPGGSGSQGVAGVFILSYLGPQRGTGGSVTFSGGFTIHTFVSSGVYIA